MNSQLNKILEKFDEVCQYSDRVDLATMVRSKVQKPGWLNAELMKRIETGSIEDLSSFLLMTVGKLPVGLKSNFIRFCLEVRDHFQKKVSFSQPLYKAQPLKRNPLLELVQDWKRGKVSPESVFVAVNRMVVNREVRAEDAQAVVSCIMRHGCHDAQELRNPLKGRYQTQSTICSLEEINHLSVVGNGQEDEDVSLNVQCTRGAYICIDPAQRAPDHDIHVSPANCATSYPNLWWKHVGDSDCVLLESCRCGAAGSTTGTTGATNATTFGMLSSTLLIGDSIRMHDAVIDVHRVIAVDALSSLSRDCQSSSRLSSDNRNGWSNGSQCLRLAVLVEGLLLPTAGSINMGLRDSTSTTLRRAESEGGSGGGGDAVDTTPGAVSAQTQAQIPVVVDAYPDGETEVYSPRLRRSNPTSSDEDEEDEDYLHNLPPRELEKRYLVVFLIVLDLESRDSVRSPSSNRAAANISTSSNTGGTGTSTAAAAEGAGAPAGLVTHVTHVAPAVVECVCALRDCVVHDQTPTSIRYLAPSVAVISGSNGLLGIIRAGSSACSSAFPAPCSLAPAPAAPLTSCADAVDAGMDNGEGGGWVCVSAHRAGSRRSYTYCSLVEDEGGTGVLEKRGGEYGGAAASHRISSVITAVDSSVQEQRGIPSSHWTSTTTTAGAATSRGRVVDAPHGGVGAEPRSNGSAAALMSSSTSDCLVTLVTGDDEGTICVWCVDALRGRGRLVCPPFRLSETYAPHPQQALMNFRVQSLHISPSGSHVAVGLFDRLLMLSTHSDDGCELNDTNDDDDDDDDDDDVCGGIGSGGGGEDCLDPSSSLSASKCAYGSFSTLTAERPSRRSHLHVRCMLDIVSGIYVRYFVSYLPESLRIWRIVNVARKPVPTAARLSLQHPAAAAAEVAAPSQSELDSLERMEEDVDLLGMRYDGGAPSSNHDGNNHDQMEGVGVRRATYGHRGDYYENGNYGGDRQNGINRRITIGGGGGGDGDSLSEIHYSSNSSASIDSSLMSSIPLQLQEQEYEQEHHPQPPQQQQEGGRSASFLIPDVLMRLHVSSGQQQGETGTTAGRNYEHGVDSFSLNEPTSLHESTPPSAAAANMATAVTTPPPSSALSATSMPTRIRSRAPPGVTSIQTDPLLGSGGSQFQQFVSNSSASVSASASSSSSNAGLAITSWLFPNLDAFEHRFGVPDLPLNPNSDSADSSSFYTTATAADPHTESQKLRDCSAGMEHSPLTPVTATLPEPSAWLSPPPPPAAAAAAAAVSSSSTSSSAFSVSFAGTWLDVPTADSLESAATMHTPMTHETHTPAGTTPMTGAMNSDSLTHRGGGVDGYINTGAGFSTSSSSSYLNARPPSFTTANSDLNLQSPVDTMDGDSQPSIQQQESALLAAELRRGDRDHSLSMNEAPLSPAEANMEATDGGGVNTAGAGTGAGGSIEFVQMDGDDEYLPMYNPPPLSTDMLSSSRHPGAAEYTTTTSSDYMHYQAHAQLSPPPRLLLPYPPSSNSLVFPAVSGTAAPSPLPRGEIDDDNEEEEEEEEEEDDDDDDDEEEAILYPQQVLSPTSPEAVAAAAQAALEHARNVQRYRLLLQETVAPADSSSNTGHQAPPTTSGNHLHAHSIAMGGRQTSHSHEFFHMHGMIRPDRISIYATPNSQQSGGLHNQRRSVGDSDDVDASFASSSSSSSSSSVSSPLPSAGGEEFSPNAATAALMTDAVYMKLFIHWYHHDRTQCFERVRHILAILCTCYQPPSMSMVAAALDMSASDVERVIYTDMADLLHVSVVDHKAIVCLRPPLQRNVFHWLVSPAPHRVGQMFWIDPATGHNRLCALFLKCCGNKSVAVEHPWKDYLSTYGPAHLRRCSRGLRALTHQIRKIDETSNIKDHLPRQIGYITGLYEIYARRVGLRGQIPKELGQLRNLRVLSMGNNHLCGELPPSLGQLKNLQRIVLHQNNLRGSVPAVLGQLGCIVNLAGNPLLHHGPDVPAHERQALVDLYRETDGPHWQSRTYWCTDQPVAKWYKVGVLSSHVHSIVMSTNGMEGQIPASIGQLSRLRMVELATMPGLTGGISPQLCAITTLRRLCICRCGLTGRIPPQIGDLTGLEELQLFGNNLNGSIPSSISRLTNLKLLSLGEYTGGNDFNAEPLPSCLSHLIHLEALFMANCNVKGPLPHWLGDLTELRQLDLQRNNLMGSIPGCIGNLENLLYLNVKENIRLGGRLPVEDLLRLNKLNRLSLVQCNFIDTEYALDRLKTHLPRCKVWI